MSTPEKDGATVVQLACVAGAVEKTSVVLGPGDARSVDTWAGSWQPVFIDLAPSKITYSVDQ